MRVGVFIRNTLAQRDRRNKEKADGGGGGGVWGVGILFKSCCWVFLYCVRVGAVEQCCPLLATVKSEWAAGTLVGSHGADQCTVSCGSNRSVNPPLRVLMNLCECVCECVCVCVCVCHCRTHRTLHHIPQCCECRVARLNTTCIWPRITSWGAQ